MRFRLIAAIAFAGLLHVPAARAQDPCAEDVKKFCGSVKVGSGRVRDCLRQNEAKLSPACNEKRAATETRFRGFIEQFVAACGRDAKKLCSEVQPGRGRVLACLLRQFDDLSIACRGEAERVQTAAETIKTVRDACRADVERLCGGVPPDAGSLVECLQANREGVSETCRSVDPQVAMQAAELVDAIDALSSEERTQEALQILQGIESIDLARGDEIGERRGRQRRERRHSPKELENLAVLLFRHDAPPHPSSSIPCTR